MELEIRGILEGVIPLGMHPRTSIMVVLQVLLEDGSVLACALNAACAALVDAGVPMSSMYASVGAALTADERLVLDPDAAEERAAHARFCFTFPHHFDLTAGAEAAVVAEPALGCRCTGRFSAAQLLEAAAFCAGGAERVAAFARCSLARSLQAA